MVGEEGFEPPTLWSQTRCATKLRYSPERCICYSFFLEAQALKPDFLLSFSRSVKTAAKHVKNVTHNSTLETYKQPMQHN